MTISALSAILALGLFGGCTGGEPQGGSDAPDATPKTTRDTLVVGWQRDVGNLLSVVSDNADDSNVLEQITFPMVDNEFDCSLKKTQALAKVWGWNDDGTVLQMELRDDITWEDGTKVTVEDLAFTYDLVADPITTSPRINFVEQMRADARPKVIDATHIEWHFTQPYDRDTQMSHVGLTLMPKHVMAEADRGTLRGHELSNAPLSYGPFRLLKWEPKQRLVLEPNPNFTGPDHWKAKLDRVIFRVIPEYSTRMIELEQGRIDLMTQVLVADADRLREDHPEINIERRGWRSNDYVTWNTKSELFSDVRVRRAMAMAADPDAMIERLLTSKKTGEKYARRSVSTITPALCGVHNDDITPIAHDLDAAKALFAEAGWRDSDNDGILDNGGRKFSFTLLTNIGNKRRADAAVLLQDQFKQVGIEVEIKSFETNTFYDRLKARDYDAALGGWQAGLFVDPSSMWACETEDTPRKFNFPQYCDPEVDTLIQQGLMTPSPQDSAPIWKDVQAKIYEDQPYLFLWWMDELVAVHERFENISVNELSPLHHLHEWEVPEDKVKYR